MAKYELDEIDRKILAYLIANARMPFLEIARECGISGAAIHQRFKKLEEAGIINGSRLVVSPKALGYDVCAFVGVQLNKPDLRSKAIELLEYIHEVVECHFITGRNSMLLKMYCVNNDHLMDVIVKKIQQIPGVSHTETFLSLDEPFNQREVDILEQKS